MSVRFYMDVHVPRALTEGLRLRSIDVLTAHEDSARRLTDPELLAEATQRQRAGRSFAGLVYAHQLQVTIGQCVHDLELIAAAARHFHVQERCRLTAISPSRSAAACVQY